MIYINSKFIPNDKPKMLNPTNTSGMYLYPSQTNTRNTQRKQSITSASTAIKYNFLLSVDFYHA